MNEFEEEEPLISDRDKTSPHATNSDAYFSVATGGFDPYEWQRDIAYTADMQWGGNW